jgi:hypothetical protein
MLNLCESHCFNAIWSLKGPKGFHFSILFTFFCQKNSIQLQRIQASSILNRMVIVNLTTSRLLPLYYTLPIVTTNLFANDRFVTWKNKANLLQWPIIGVETFWHLVWTNLTSYKFSLFLVLIPFYIFQIYDVFTIKVL